MPDISRRGVISIAAVPYGNIEILRQNVMECRESNILPAVLLSISAATVAVSVILLFLGFYVFIFFLPIAFCIPWSLGRLTKKKNPLHWA
jgi:hypothetical protein